MDRVKLLSTLSASRALIIACFLPAPVYCRSLCRRGLCDADHQHRSTAFSWNAVLVLAMVPMIHSGCGLNFGLPLGIISGLLGATLSIEFGFTGP